jgi:UDP-2,3-diacylglucosamine hydrolase
MATIFISDLHLSREVPERTALCCRLIHHLPNVADRLYILGDLFEIWLGDDLLDGVGQQVAAALHGASDRGVEIALLRGNRDFLLGEQFAALANCKIIEDPCVVEVEGYPTLLMHGDLLCSDDKPYQQMRTQLRNPVWIADFLGKPSTERIAFARALRDRSREETAEKCETIMDVNPATTLAAMQQAGVKRLIHGHTHRRGYHRLALASGEVGERWVLGDWQQSGDLLYCNGDQWQSMLVNVDQSPVINQELN